jgi:predicted kinase
MTDMTSLSNRSPRLLIMTGIPKAGKSFFAEKFTSTFKAPLVSFDKISKFADQNTAAKTCDYLLEELLKTNETVVYDGPSNLNKDRLAVAKKAREAGYQPLLVWVQTETNTAKSRAAKAKLSPEQFDNHLKRFSPPNSKETPVVISGKHTYVSQVKVVLKKLGRPAPEATANTRQLKIQQPSRIGSTARR